MKSFSQLFAFILFVGSCNLFAATDQGYHLETVTEDITIPWGMVWLANGDMLVSDRSGSLHRVTDGKAGPAIEGVPEVHVNGQGGLLDLELHPNYQDNGWIYLTYSEPEGLIRKSSHTTLMRAKLDGNKLIEKEILYQAGPRTSRGQHYGGRIEFDDKGFVYFSIGERGNRDVNPQDITRDGGKIYRLNDDGSIPADNPFINQTGAKKAIYSYGHRNPEGMSKNPSDGSIWVHEHGPQGGDEVNIIKPGANYGWPILSYGINYSGSKFAEGTEREGFESPAWYWVPSIAPSGMTFVTSDKYPEWQGHLLVGSLKFSYLVLCHVEGNTISTQDTLFQGIGRVRTVKQGPDGFLYVSTEGQGIKRIVPN